MPNLTETEVREAQRDAASLEAEAADLRERANSKLADMRDAGTDPLRDAEAFDTLDDLWKEADGKQDEANALRSRASRAASQLGERGNGGGVQTRDRRDEDRADSLAARITESEGYAELRKNLGRDLSVAARAFGTVDMATRDEYRAMLTRDVTISGESLVTDDRQPGIVNANPYRPVRVLDAINVGETDSDTIDTVIETSPTENVDEAPYNEANGVEFDDSNVLPESAYGFDEVTYSVKRIGHYVPVSEGQLADAAQLRSLIDPRLTGGVRRKLEDLVVNGATASGDAWDGIYAGILAGNQVTRDTANSESRHDAVHRAITLVRIANEAAPGDEAEPTAIGFHPTDWENLVLEKDADGNYLNRQGYQVPGTVWGMRPIISTVFTQGTPLLGDYDKGAFLWMREGVSTTMTDSHKDWFLRGWLAMKAQTRAAFGLVVARAFATVDSF